jgi:hypothetical protein
MQATTAAEAVPAFHKVMGVRTASAMRAKHTLFAAASSSAAAQTRQSIREDPLPQRDGERPLAPPTDLRNLYLESCRRRDPGGYLASS